jgi:YidC/Oxa1 family membrane protein insertase
MAAAAGNATTAAPIASCKSSAAPVAAAAVALDSAGAHAPASASSAAAAALPSVPPASPTLADIYGAEDVPLVLDHLSQWWSVLQLQDLIGWLHTTADLPWWGSIAAATVCLRVLVIPLEVLQLRNSLRMKQILPDVERIQAQMTAAATEEEKRVHAVALLQLFKDKKCDRETSEHTLRPPMPLFDRNRCPRA